MSWLWNRYRHKKNIQRTKDKAEGLDSDLNKNLQMIRQQVGYSPGVIIREFVIGRPPIHAAAVYTDGLADKEMASKFVRRSLMTEAVDDPLKESDSPQKLFQNIIRMP